MVLNLIVYSYEVINYLVVGIFLQVSMDHPCNIKVIMLLWCRIVMHIARVMLAHY